MIHLPEETLFGFEFTFMDSMSQKIKEGGTLTPELRYWWENLDSSFHENFALKFNTQKSKLEEARNVIGLPVYKYNFPENEDFWLILNVDPEVVEIQSKPITFKQIIDNKILEKLFDCMLTVNGMLQGNGGGHINVDYTTGFGRNFNLIRKTLQASEDYYLNNIRVGTPSFVIDIGYLQHDPFLNCDRIKASEVSPAKNYYFDWQNNVAIRKDMNKFKNDHAAWLLAHPTNEQDNKKVLIDRKEENRVAKALHYQAVNIEHLYEAEEHNRLEFRFFKAQTSIEDIITGIEIIDKIVGDAKDPSKKYKL